MGATSSPWPYGISSDAIKVVQDVIAYQEKLIDIYGAKFKHLHSDKKKTSELLIGLWFLMEDHRGAAKEA
jgi:hypothetical protein